MIYVPLDEDPEVPEGAVQVAEVVVTQYLDETGAMKIRTFYDGEIPLSSVLGLLAMGGIQIYQRCEP